VKKFSAINGTEYPVPCSQQPTTFPHRKPDEYQTDFCQTHLNIILPSMSKSSKSSLYFRSITYSAAKAETILTLGKQLHLKTTNSCSSVVMYVSGQSCGSYE